MNAGDYGVLGVGWAEWGGRGGNQEKKKYEAWGEAVVCRKNILNAHELGGGDNEASTGGGWSQTSVRHDHRGTGVSQRGTGNSTDPVCGGRAGTPVAPLFCF